MALPRTTEGINYLFKARMAEGVPNAGWHMVTDFPQIDQSASPVLAPPLIQVINTSGIAYGFETNLDQGAFGTLSLPAGYAPGTDYYIGVAYQNAGAALQNMRWEIATNVGNPFYNDVFTEYITKVTDSAPPGSQYGSILSEFSVYPGTGLVGGEQIMYTLKRLGTATEDTFTGTAILICVYLLCQVDRIALRNKTAPFYNT